MSAPVMWLPWRQQGRQRRQEDDRDRGGRTTGLLLPPPFAGCAAGSHSEATTPKTATATS